MRCKKLIGWMVGLSLFGGGMASANAQSFQSPNTISPITPPTIAPVTPPGIASSGSKSDAEAASTLLQELTDAEEACAKSQAAPGGSRRFNRSSIAPELIASTEPRRFSQGPADPNAACISPECERLYNLLEEANTFLSNFEAGGSTSAASQTW